MSSYEVHLAEFEGPLDLLLHLVHKSEIDLKDIFISQITEQYLELMREVGEIDLDRASDFLRTASLLLYIKSRTLLPKPPVLEEAEEDPEKMLLAQLALYQIYKTAARCLEGREGAGNAFFEKLPDEFPGCGPDFELTSDAESLKEAFRRALNREIRRIPHPSEAAVQVARDTWTISLQKKEIIRELRLVSRVTFEELLGNRCPPEKIVVTFAALLELWSTNAVRVQQSCPFGPIELMLHEKAESAA